MSHAEAARKSRDRGSVLHAKSIVVDSTETGRLPQRVPTQHERSGFALSSESDGGGSLLLSSASRIFAGAIVGLLFLGFAVRSRDLLVPEEGWGYILGVAGGTTMLLLLFYPMVKRMQFFGFGTHSAAWLRVHMLLGLIGPMLIFYHSNFSMGATNSNIALFSMILVATSGVVGRYIYTRVHRGLSAVRTDLNGLLASSSRLLQVIGEDAGGNNGFIAKAMADFASHAISPHGGIFINLAMALVLPIRAAFAKTRIMAEVRSALSRNARKFAWSRGERHRRLLLARQHVGEFLFISSRVSQLGFWERMFSLWHVFHVPLFFVLFVSGVIHVVAVHMY